MNSKCRSVYLSEREGGFTLVEMIVAMLILTVVLVSLIGVQLSAAVSVTEARKLEQASALANESLEQLRAIPWSVLSQGLHPDFLVQSGGDDNVEDGKLKLDDPSRSDPTLLVAGPGIQTGQWLPLFDTNGSNMQVKPDPSGTGVVFEVRTYLLTQGVTQETGTLGAVVIVEWDGRSSERRKTMMESTIYPSGCGDNATNPFATSCEPYLEGSASSGKINVGVSATDDAEPRSAQALGVPADAGFFEVGMNTASATSKLQSQQVDLADASVAFGGSIRGFENPESDRILEGFALESVRASSDLAEQDRWPLHVGSTARSQSISAEQTVSVGGSLSGIDVLTRSDRARVGTIGASMEQACFPGVAPGETCGLSSIAHSSSDTGAAFMELVVSGLRIEAVAQTTSGNANTDRAWTARFSDVGGTSAVGCSVLTGTGCVAAGAEQTLSPVAIGRMVTGDWTGEAPLGLAVLDGGSCLAGHYSDSVTLELGPNQSTSSPVTARCGAVQLWNGTDYTTVDIGLGGTSSPLVSDEVEWSDGTTTVTAVATVSTTPVSWALPSGTCPDSGCTKSSDAGTVSINTQYRVDLAGDVHNISVSMDVVGSSARAAFSQAGDIDAE
ncbi:prepilin-type N-terminal cleavage/methylation domain-containing protein [Demequina sp. NBRC 110051]|uniref:type IV pilus modification PilV family protein n=1 Tax=Demequina sp. NBRC 110051 TaxID=1570340 RepID=UPI000A02D845|nr:type II secretion system protein [Demequina sp. NBRC 110051]